MKKIMLTQAIVEALRPRGLPERARTRMVGGWTALQVRERLAPDAVEAWLAAQPGERDVAERRLVDAVRTALLGLVAEGRAVRRASRFSVDLRSKGARDVLVDLFRLA